MKCFLSSVCSRILFSSAVALCFLLCPEGGHANTRVAKKHFKKAEVHYKAGRFHEAREDYAKAYRAKPLPQLLFNISQCHMELKEYQQAIFYYQSFLRDDPDTPNRDLAKERIAEAKRLLAKDKKKTPTRAKKLVRDKKRAPGATQQAPSGGPSDKPEEPSEDAPRLEAQASAEQTGANEQDLSESVPEPVPSADQQSIELGLDEQRAVAAVVEEEPLTVPPPHIEREVGETPFYKSWWFWGVVGVAAVASGVATVIMSRRSDTRGFPKDADWCVDVRTPEAPVPCPGT